MFLGGCYYLSDVKVLESGERAPFTEKIQKIHCRVNNKVSSSTVEEVRDGVISSSYKYISDDGQISMSIKLGDNFYLEQTQLPAKLELQVGSKYAYAFSYNTSPKRWTILVPDFRILQMPDHMLTKKQRFLEKKLRAMVKHFNLEAEGAQAGVKITGSSENMKGFLMNHTRDMLIEYGKCIYE